MPIGVYIRTKKRSWYWKNHSIGKIAMHKWVEKWKGKPQYCEHCRTTKKRKYQWANIDHTYKRTLDDYIRLCVPCHRKFDKERGCHIGRYKKFNKIKMYYL